jgi:tetratricopeptide (TPR) repeat protein
MPAHIYLRTGRYEDAIRANEHAVAADESYIRDRRMQSYYTIAYYPHNYHFLAFAAMLAGEEARAIDAARAAASTIPLDIAATAPDLQLVTAYPYLMLTTFGRHADVLREPLPPATLRVATGLAHFARGMSAAALRRGREARLALDSVRAVSREMTAYPVEPVMRIAERVLAAEISLRDRVPSAAIGPLTQAMEIEDAMTYMEPPYWHQPVRHYLAEALIQAGRAAEAERLYREDLERFPRNVWSERGLLRATRER